MCKIRRIFLFLAAAFLIALAGLSSGALICVGAEEREAAVVTVDGNRTEYADCFTVNGEKALTQFTLPQTVTGFYSVIVPDGVVRIENGVFEHQRIKSVVVPSSVQTIGQGAFRGCALLSSVEIAEGDKPLTISDEAFSGCWALEGLALPARCATIGTNAFADCSLRWVFLNAAASLNQEASFGNATVVFSKKADYETALSANKVTAENATFVVTFAFYAEKEQPLFTLSKLYGRDFSFEYTDAKVWQKNAAITDLPAQDEHYASTVWYRNEEFTQKATLADVNELLKSADKSAEISLYAHATVAPPSVKRTVTHPYEKEGYALSDAQRMCGLVGIEDYEQKGALVFSAFAEGGAGALTSIGSAGTYLVSVSLNGEYGTWKSQLVTTLTVTGGQERTTQIMLVLLSVIGLLAVALTIALAAVRSRAGKKKHKELTSEEVIDKFIAAGGRTRLKK